MKFSVLIPTRHRLERLKKTISSIYSTSDNPSDIEIVVRVQTDDNETLDGVPDLEKMGKVKIIYGAPLGYIGDAIYFWELSNAASGIWLWGMNDDVVPDGCSKGWDMSRCFDSVKTIVMPGVHRVGGSTYRKDGACPFFFVPNKWWEEFKLTAFGHPTDAMILGVLRSHGWKTEYLPNLSVHHQRDPSDRLMKEEGRV